MQPAGTRGSERRRGNQWRSRRLLEAHVCSLRHAEHDRNHADERRNEGDEVDRRDEPRSTVGRGAEDRELSGERPERRSPGDREEPQHPEGTGDGCRAQDAPHVVHALGTVHRENVPRGEEEGGLHQRMVGGVEQRPPRSRPADPDADGEDPHVLHARPGEQALVIRLAEQQGRGHDHGQEPDLHEGVPGERPETGGLADAGEAQHPEEGAVQERPGEQRGNRGRRLAVGIGQPGVKRHQSHLGAVPDQHEDEGGLQPPGVEAARTGDQLGECQGHVTAVGRRCSGGEEVGAEQRDGDAHGAHEQVLPRGFERPGAAVQADQGSAHQRGRFDRDPEQAGVPAQADEGHGREEPGKAGGQHGHAPRVGVVRRRVRHRRGRRDGRRGEQEARDREHQEAGGVQGEPVAHGSEPAGVEPPPGQETRVRDRSADQQDTPARSRTERERGERCGSGHQEEREDHGGQSRSSESRSASRWSNSRPMRNTVIPMTKTAANASRNVPISTSSGSRSASAMPKAEMPFSSAR